MNIYESPEEYAETVNISLEQAKIRCEHFLAIQKEIHESLKCPKCGQHTLEFEGGEWEVGVKDYVYCSNDKISTVDEEGDEFMEECDFTDDVKPQYKFYGMHDFDEVLYMHSQSELTLGCTWAKFVEDAMKRL